MDNAIREGTRGDQFKRNIPMAGGDERNPFADQYGNHVDGKFINRAGIQERRDNARTAHHPYVLTSHRLELADELRIESETNSTPGTGWEGGWRENA